MLRIKRSLKPLFAPSSIVVWKIGRDHTLTYNDLFGQIMLPLILRVLNSYTLNRSDNCSFIDKLDLYYQHLDKVNLQRIFIDVAFLKKL